jgi:hypothetical protein
MGSKEVYKTAKANADAKKEKLTMDGLKEARREVAMTKKMSGGMAIGGGHKNYKMTGMIKAKTGKLTEKQKTLPLHLQKAIKA